MAISVDGLRLWNTQESRSQTEASINVTSAPSQGEEDAVLTSLEAQESPGFSGTATALRLASNPDYPSDPEAALADWVQRFESLCSAEQGAGWTLQDDERNRSITAVVTEASWTRSYGAPYEVSWTIQAERGDGVLDSVARSPSTQTPNASELLGTTDLGTIDEKQTRLQLDIDTFPIAFGDTSETVITPESGVVREVSFSGRTGGALADLRAFDDEMRSKLGGNQSFTFQTAFPGTSHEVVVGDYESTFAAGDPHTLRYRATFYEGLAL